MITITTLAAAGVLFCVAIAGVIAGGLFVLLTSRRKTNNEPQPSK
jgi:hypothetical protein